MANQEAIMLIIQGLNEAAQREAQGYGSIIQHKERVRYVEGIRHIDWTYPNQKLAAASIRIARKQAANAN